jgi:hypothetical protein
MSPLPTKKAPSSSKPSNFLKTFFTVIALILFGILVGVLASRYLPASQPVEVPVVTPTPTPTIEVTPTPVIPEIIITEPASGSAIISPATIIGSAPKGWTFEGVLSILIEDSQHNKIAGGSVLTKEINTSDNRVSFETSLPFSTKVVSGFITIKNDNPSGLPENEKSFSLPVTFGSITSTTFICPASGWVDCMPVLDTAKQKACSTEAMLWYKANCPNFKGAAL